MMTSRKSRSLFARGAALLLFGILLCPLAGLFASPAAAVDAADIAARGAGYTAVLYDNSNGLPTSEANAIVQTGEGLIWIGSYSGLIRYDGNTFYRYPATSGIASVMCLFVDSRDRLWIGTNDSGAAMFRDETFTFYTRNDGLRSSSIRSIVEDRDGNILIATTKGLALVDGEGKLQLVDNPQINNEYICELFAGNDGVVYGVTLSEGIFTVEGGRVSAYYSAVDMGIAKINTIYPDPDHAGYVYIGTQNAEVYYGTLAEEMADRVLLSIAPQKNVNAIRAIEGSLWICADNGIGYFDAERRYVELLDLPMTNSIDHIMQDYEGNLWFSSSRQGVMKIVKNRFINISDLAGLDPLVVNSTHKHGGDLYIATDTGLYVLGEDYTQKANGATAALAGVRIRCIKEDRQGTLWFCTYSDHGLVSYDAATDTLTEYSAAAGLASNRVRMLTELSDGTLAVATNNGMNLLRDGTVVATYNGSNGISNLEILCIEEGANGVLYLGSDGDGIYRVEGGKVSRIGLDEGLRSEVILRLKKDPREEDLYWVITSNSIAFMREERITTIANFPYSNNFDLYFDQTGRAWILSSNGIYVVDRAELLANGNIDYTLFDTACGLPGIATANSYSFLAADGTLYLSASTGVCSVNINEDTENADEVRLCVPFITVDDACVWIHGEEEIHIPANCKRLSIYANAFTYSLNNPHLAYYLEGFDDAPVYVTKQEMPYASYTNLKGGTYRFHLSIINIVTGEAEQTVTLTLVKDRAIYEQWWFWTLFGVIAAAGAVGLVILIYRKKTAALRKKQAESQKLINEMTKVFSGCIDMKDAYTNGHSARVAKYTAMFAERLGKSKEEVEQIYNIALLHDIGKIGIPDQILNKPGRLDEEEYAVMKTHSPRGYEILKDITIAPGIAQGAGCHHERYDGKGYPNGLAGDEIPEVAQMIAVADTFDAMYSTRPYRKQMPLEAVIAEIKRVSGTQLSPRVVEVFLQLAQEGAFDKKEPEHSDPQDDRPKNV